VKCVQEVWTRPVTGPHGVRALAALATRLLLVGTATHTDRAVQSALGTLAELTGARWAQVCRRPDGHWPDLPVYRWPAGGPGGVEPAEVSADAWAALDRGEVVPFAAGPVPALIVPLGQPGCADGAVWLAGLGAAAVPGADDREWLCAAGTVIGAAIERRRTLVEPTGPERRHRTLLDDVGSAATAH
jgi:hypothetical protein